MLCVECCCFISEKKARSGQRSAAGREGGSKCNSFTRALPPTPLLGGDAGFSLTSCQHFISPGTVRGFGLVGEWEMALLTTQNIPGLTTGAWQEVEPVSEPSLPMVYSMQMVPSKGSRHTTTTCEAFLEREKNNAAAEKQNKTCWETRKHQPRKEGTNPLLSIPATQRRCQGFLRQRLCKERGTNSPK